MTYTTWLYTANRESTQEMWYQSILVHTVQVVNEHFQTDVLRNTWQDNLAVDLSGTVISPLISKVVAPPDLLDCVLRALVSFLTCTTHR